MTTQRAFIRTLYSFGHFLINSATLPGSNAGHDPIHKQDSPACRLGISNGTLLNNSRRFGRFLCGSLRQVICLSAFSLLAVVYPLRAFFCHTLPRDFIGREDFIPVFLKLELLSLGQSPPCRGKKGKIKGVGSEKVWVRLPLCRSKDHPIRSKAAKTRLALELGQSLMRLKN